MAKYILSLCVMLLVGCATFVERQRLDSFESTSRSYGEALLWEQYYVANRFRKVRGTEQQEPNFKKLKKIQVTSYELLDRDTSEDKLQVQQIVEIKYYNINYLIEKTLIDKQLWEYDATEKTWRLQGCLPNFK